VDVELGSAGILLVRRSPTERYSRPLPKMQKTERVTVEGT
jgi:hypothetical protein